MTARDRRRGLDWGALVAWVGAAVWCIAVWVGVIWFVLWLFGVPAW